MSNHLNASIASPDGKKIIETAPVSAEDIASLRAATMDRVMNPSEFPQSDGNAVAVPEIQGWRLRIKALQTAPDINAAYAALRSYGNARIIQFCGSNDEKVTSQLQKARQRVENICGPAAGSIIIGSFRRNVDEALAIVSEQRGINLPGFAQRR